MQTNPAAKRILLYGDSLVYGKIPGALRYDSATRFSGVMQHMLGDRYEIIEEGLRGRMLSGENGFFPHRNGQEQFGPIFASHAPVDIVIFFLGTNDCNAKSDKNYDDIAKAFDTYQQTMQRRCNHFKISNAKVLIICPPYIQEQYSYNSFGEIFKGSDKKVQTLIQNYIRYATEHTIAYLDTSFLHPSTIDGIHLDEKNNKILGQKLAEKITELVDTEQ